MSDPFGPVLFGAGTPAPNPFVKGAQQLAELAYEAAGLKPSHGGFLPKGIGYAAPSYFLPQPIGFADPAAYGLHHDFLFGITYDRALLLLLNPELLDQRIADAHAAPHAPAQLKQIRSGRDVGIFDFPFLLGSGQLDYLSPEGPGPQGPPGEVTDLLKQAARAIVQGGYLEFTTPSPLPTATDAVSESRARYNDAFGQSVLAREALDREQARIMGELRDPIQGAKLPFAEDVHSASILPEAIEPVADAAKRNAEAAQGIRRQLVHERADP